MWTIDIGIKPCVNAILRECMKQIQCILQQETPETGPVCPPLPESAAMQSEKPAKVRRHLFRQIAKTI